MDEDRLDRIEKSVVRMETNQSWMMETLSNHLAHHDKYLYLSLIHISEPTRPY